MQWLHKQRRRLVVVVGRRGGAAVFGKEKAARGIQLRPAHGAAVGGGRGAGRGLPRGCAQRGRRRGRVKVKIVQIPHGNLVSRMLFFGPWKKSGSAHFLHMCESTPGRGGAAHPDRTLPRAAGRGCGREPPCGRRFRRPSSKENKAPTPRSEKRGGCGSRHGALVSATPLPASVYLVAGAALCLAN